MITRRFPMIAMMLLAALLSMFPDLTRAAGEPARKTEAEPRKAAKKADFLFVQNARGIQYADGKLTLKGVSPTTIVFSDRPERLAGHMSTAEFVPFWKEGKDSFLSDPPNATLSILGSGKVADVVVVLRDPVLKGDELSYDTRVLEGEMPADGGAASLFIDAIGRPLTPMSFAGADRRMWRRANSGDSDGDSDDGDSDSGCSDDDNSDDGCSNDSD
ncbi:MAG: hypothetical protein P9F75_10045 [Candidatus Contendobacter sp.]|nr:hypothetical protein [Candidatus Contendobacter sp.]